MGYRRVSIAALAVVGVLVGPAVAAGGPTIKVSPGTVQAGQIVRVYGVVPGCPSGNEVTLISAVFSHAHDFAGLPAVFAHVGAHSAYSVRTRIPATRRTGRYQITGRCGGGNLGAIASLRVWLRPCRVRFRRPTATTSSTSISTATAPGSASTSSTPTRAALQ